MVEKKEPAKTERTWTEEIEVASDDLVGLIKEYIEDASVTRVIVRNAEGQTLLEVPVMHSAAVAGALVLFTPVLAALGAMAALVANFRVEIVRTEAGDEDAERANGDDGGKAS
ncbi:MAG: DUF4342 domain-containing protein [Alphaproteobacteria bacterium]|nr:DUF4342 domain-containing protein [Alphaproteobacteria bacterium]